ncbi:Uncharacterised protein [Rodentibacter pneumotropicus]|uniref:Uncharacterized protein n=1 Tax=Rodentibacter pneumotropicus TaxID=758 RepID=A0A3S4UBQ6_9PAST|nr:hypothetical protein [Rodentibacter pneumotropicus]MDC2825544.1 hypothetical protein [Rodentibacter pneumotropicus]VEH68396.1 Uncharacterised protein [Rodentibacter pneumotropicus]
MAYDSGNWRECKFEKIDNFFIELLKQDYTVDVGKLDSKEIDFIARKSDEILYIQVAF